MAYEKEKLIPKDLPQDLQKILLWTTKRLSDSIKSFIREIDTEIGQLRESGISNAEISKIIKSDFDTRGRIFGRFLNSVKRGIVSGAMFANRSGQDSVYGDSLRFKWVSVGSPRICVDCKGRIGVIKTWNKWESVGLPSSGFSVCKEYCYCQLVPANIDIDDKVILK